MRKISLCLLAAIIIFALSSCSGGISEVYPEVVGTWELVYNSTNMPTISPSKTAYRKGSGYYEFDSGGTALVPVTADENGNARSIKCELAATETEMTVSYNGINVISGKFTRMGEKLTVTNEATGAVFIFTKVKE